MDASDVKFEELLDELASLRRRVAELEAAADRAEEIISAIGDGISIVGPDFRVLYQNEIHEEMVGGSKVGQFCYRAYAKSESVCPACPVEKALKAGGTHRLETSVFSAGRLTHLEVLASPLKGGSGRAVAVVEVVRDITARKEAEKRQREAFFRLEALIEAIPHAAFFKDAEGRHLVVNDATCKFMGRSREEILGKTAEELLPPEIARICRHSDELVLKGKRAVHLGEVFESGEGQSFFETIKSPLLDDEGNVLGLVGMAHDVTWRKRTDEALNEVRERYRSVVEDLPDLICRYRPDTTITFVNEAYAQYFGRSREELIGKSFLELIPPEDHEYVQKSVASLSRRNPVTSMEHKVISSDGRLRWHLWRDRALFDAAGNIIEIQSIGQDITDRKRDEEQLRKYQEHLEEMVRERTAELTAAVDLLQEQILEGRKSQKFILNILESIDDSLLVLDSEYRILTANRAFCERTGLSLEEAAGVRCYELLHNRKEPCFVSGESCSARRAFISGEPSTSMHNHGSAFVETKSYPMRDDAGRIVSVIQVIHDVTEKRKLEEQLRHSQKMEAVGQLAGGVAHDFNNRLAAIMNYAFILKTKLPPGDPLLAHVNQILNSSERAAHLTKNLLTFSRKHTIDPRPVKLNDIVSGIEKLIARALGEDIEFKAELASDELVVMADRDQIEHVLINLATNSKDAMSGPGRVTLSTSRVELGRKFFEGRSNAKPGPYALITFSDTGQGMDPETASRVFEPFFTTKEVGKGTGLGLSIVYGIVKQHGGYVRVESTPGLGTTFHIYIPLLAARADQFEPDDRPAPAGGTETVLLVEDDEDVRKPLRQMLEGFGYEVIEAVDGHDAVEKFLQSRKKVGLLMLDVVLPGMNGVEALREIRKVEPGVRAIFTSGYSEDHVRRKGLLESGTVFLSKPVLPEVLLQKLREALDR